MSRRLGRGALRSAHVPPLAEDIGVNVYPVMAFNKVFNEYFRDQDLQTERDPDDTTVPQVNWQKDYLKSGI